jgi:hypothetical protein
VRRCVTYSFTCHGEIGAISIALNGMELAHFGNDIKKILRRPDLGDQKDLDSKEANNSSYDKRVEVVRQESGLDTTNKGIEYDANGQ